MPAEDPIGRFRRLFAAARRARVPLPEAAALATADTSARPSVRFVLVKQVDERGFVVFTDGRSRKGADLRANRRAALVFYWDATGRQVRVEGTVEEVDAETVDAYWRTRPRESRLAAAASHQSAVLRGRADLARRVARLRDRYRGRPIPRPSDWTGFRVSPDRIEIWKRGAHRLHQRELYTRRGKGWRKSLLQP